MKKDNYSHHYLKWHSLDPFYHKSLSGYYERLIRNSVSEDKNIRILDIGSAAGFFLQTLYELGYTQAEGIDIDQGLVELCKEKGLRVTCVADSSVFLEGNKSSYDVVTMFDVLEHIDIKTVLAFVSKIQEALKPDGVFIGTVPNANSALGLRWRYIDFTHTMSFTESSLDYLLHMAGFENIEISPIEFSEKPKLELRNYKLWIQFLVMKYFRTVRWLELYSELGRAQANKIPLSLNLHFTAKK